VSQKEELERAARLGQQIIDDPDMALDDMKAFGRILLFYLWDTDDDPNRKPWPGGPNDEAVLRIQAKMFLAGGELDPQGS